VPQHDSIFKVAAIKKYFHYCRVWRNKDFDGKLITAAVIARQEAILLLKLCLRLTKSFKIALCLAMTIDLKQTFLSKPDNSAAAPSFPTRATANGRAANPDRNVNADFQNKIILTIINCVAVKLMYFVYLNFI
jgi:hypothetical protein